MDWIKPTQAFIEKWWVYVDWCLKAETQAPVCQPFWSWATGASLVIVILAVVWAVVKFISYRIKLSAALRAEEYRAAIADEETMREHTWDGDKAYQTDIPAEEVERRIKNALVARANQGKVPPIV